MSALAATPGSDAARADVASAAAPLSSICCSQLCEDEGQSFDRLGHGQSNSMHLGMFIDDRRLLCWSCYADASGSCRHDRQLTSASLFARVSARAVTASCDAKPLLLSSMPPPLVIGVIGITGTRSRNKGCAPFADLTFFYTSKTSNHESVQQDSGLILDADAQHA